LAGWVRCVCSGLRGSAPFERSVTTATATPAKAQSAKYTHARPRWPLPLSLSGRVVRGQKKGYVLRRLWVHKNRCKPMRCARRSYGTLDPDLSLGDASLSPGCSQNIGCRSWPPRRSSCRPRWISPERPPRTRRAGSCCRAHQPRAGQRLAPDDDQSL
jgi:hypothetical protein